jgi:TatA/E family protein of Tat protein translocase
VFEGIAQSRHFLISFLIAVVVFGPGKSAEAAMGLGKGIREFRSSIKEISAPETTAKSNEAGTSNGKEA